MNKKQKFPYSGSTLTPDQSMIAITKLLESLDCKDYQWTTISGEKTLRFALKVTIKGVERLMGFSFKPPRLTKTVRSYNPKTYRYENVAVNDDVTAFRVLFWYMKNKVIAVQTGLVSAEEEFMPHILMTLPNGKEQTLYERLQDELLGLPAPSGFAMLPQPDKKPADSEEKKDDEKIVSTSEYTVKEEPQS